MSTYPGENPQPTDGDQPGNDTEPTQPVGYWEREAAARQAAAEQAGQSGPDPTTAYPQDSAPGAQGPAAPQSPYGAPGPPPYAGQPGASSVPPGYYPAVPGGVPGQPPYSAFSPVLPAQRQSTLAMVLGLVALVGSFFTCGVSLVVAPFAWAVGHSSVKEIEASHGRLGGESQARAGMIMGIVGTVLLILAILALIAVVVLIVVSAGTGTTTGSSGV